MTDGKVTKATSRASRPVWMSSEATTLVPGKIYAAQIYFDPNKSNNCVNAGDEIILWIYCRIKTPY